MYKMARYGTLWHVMARYGTLWHVMARRVLHIVLFFRSGFEILGTQVALYSVTSGKFVYLRGQ